MSSLLFPAYNLNWKNSQPENMCDIVFEETKGHGGTVNKTSVYAAAAPQPFFKKYVKRNFAEFTRSHNLFFGAFLGMLQNL